jgi:hypothetical protein
MIKEELTKVIFVKVDLQFAQLLPQLFILQLELQKRVQTAG